MVMKLSERNKFLLENVQGGKSEKNLKCLIFSGQKNIWRLKKKRTEPSGLFMKLSEKTGCLHLKKCLGGQSDILVI